VTGAARARAGRFAANAGGDAKARSIVLGAVLGGVTVFVWSAVSWMLLPWHESSMKSFADEAAVAQVILDNAPIANCT
jgi:hypothetical protein